MRTESKLTIDGEQVVVLRSRDATKPVNALLLSSGQLLTFNAGTTDKGIENSRIVRDQLARIKDRPTEAVDSATGKTVQKAFVYALTGAVTSYNILRSQNYSKLEALALLPAGGLRDVVQTAVLSGKADQYGPFLEVVQKGTVGGVLVFASNWGVSRKIPQAMPEKDLHIAQIATAFTVNGFVIGTKELLKLTGNAPKNNPVGMDQWMYKVMTEAAGIGAGVSVTMGGLDSYRAVKAGANAFSPDARKTYVKAFLYPALQYIVASYLTDGPKLTTGESSQLNDLQKSLAGVGGYVATDKLYSMIKKKPGNEFNAGQSVRWAMGSAALAQILDVYENAKSLDKLDIRKPDSAKIALEKINQLLEIPAIHIQSKIFDGGNYIRQLESDRNQIYQNFPSLKTQQKPQIKI